MFKMSVYESREQVAGAYKNGTRVEKINSDAKDAHRDGDKATVIGSIGDFRLGLAGYFVHWDDTPNVPVFIAGFRVRLADVQY